MAVAVGNYAATVTVKEADRLRIVPTDDDRNEWASLDELAMRVLRHGYRTGVQVLQAAMIGFARWRSEVGEPVPALGLELSYHTTIPRHVGLAGSSALMAAAQEALAAFYEIEIPAELRASIAFRSGTEELGLVADLGDSVAQIQGGVTAMDFSPERVLNDNGLMIGRYESLDFGSMPPLYLASLDRPPGPAEEVHGDLDMRHAQGDRAVLDGLRRLASLAAETQAALRWHDAGRLGELIDTSFDIYTSIADVPASVVDLVDAARRVEATATYAGRGTTIVGTYEDARHLASIADLLSTFGATTIDLNVAAPRSIRHD